ncbi:uncharacterized protein LOC143360841 [Halictus rubicundus]|uniref:uncharacterized protein LOC143360841 n=1 Tax=Halictus rubicundus TaxID=77578 RepID=UPI004036D1E5
MEGWCGGGTSSHITSPSPNAAFYAFYVAAYKIVSFLLLVALPICVAQFRIQGPSDGNRAAESLSVDDSGNVQFTPSTGGFTIQGATDGHSNVQGASDGHSNFQLQGSTAAGANRYLQPAAPAPPAFSIQGATDGHSQIQGSYDGSSSGKSLQYDDPSGYRVNWRSYDRQVRPPSQPEAQYSEVQDSLPRAPQRQRARARPQQHAQPQPQPQPQRQPQSHDPLLPPAQPLENASPEIKQLLHYQQMLPYINIIPEPFRFNAEAAVKDQADAVRAHFQELANAPPERYAPRPRQRRQAQYSHRQQQPQQPPAEPPVQYSTNLPGFLKDLLNFQAQVPYTILPNLVGVTRPEKPYVPQPVQSPTPSPVPAPLPAAQPHYQSQGNAYQGQPQYQGQPNVAYQGQAQAANAYQNQIGSYQNQAGAYQDQGSVYQGQQNVYKNQADAYQPQQNAYNQVYQSELKYPQYSQGQPGRGGVRPVTENQY